MGLTVDWFGFVFQPLAIEEAKRSGTPYTTGPRSRNRIEGKLVGFDSSDGTPFTERTIKAALNKLLAKGVVENVKMNTGKVLRSTPAKCGV